MKVYTDSIESRFQARKIIDKKSLHTFIFVLTSNVDYFAIIHKLFD